MNRFQFHQIVLSFITIYVDFWLIKDLRNYFGLLESSLNCGDCFDWGRLNRNRWALNTRTLPIGRDFLAFSQVFGGKSKGLSFWHGQDACNIIIRIGMVNGSVSRWFYAILANFKYYSEIVYSIWSWPKRIYYVYCVFQLKEPQENQFNKIQ